MELLAREWSGLHIDILVGGRHLPAIHRRDDLLGSWHPWGLAGAAALDALACLWAADLGRGIEPTRTLHLIGRNDRLHELRGALQPRGEPLACPGDARKFLEVGCDETGHCCVGLLEGGFGLEVPQLDERGRRARRKLHVCHARDDGHREVCLAALRGVEGLCQASGPREAVELRPNGEGRYRVAPGGVQVLPLQKAAHQHLAEDLDLATHGAFGAVVRLQVVLDEDAAQGVATVEELHAVQVESLTLHRPEHRVDARPDLRRHGRRR
mmetsp:Transcript_7966/g.18321  ORF Transcript_7966/g.18321 Transcript_7966/m.18321 type:complete len:268 (+) Transcript_7966:321-1124(+)